MNACLVPGCNRPAHAKSYCDVHYRRWRRTGRPEGRGTSEERFWAKVIRRSDYECWEWDGGHDTSGYARFHVSPDRRREGAHRFAYELLRGVIPEGMELDHLCRNKGCVNPYHLEPVTRSVNVLRGIQASPRTHKQACPRGHALEGDNLYRYVDSKGRVAHLCKECRRVQWRQSKARRNV